MLQTRIKNRLHSLGQILPGLKNRPDHEYTTILKCLTESSGMSNMFGGAKLIPSGRATLDEVIREVVDERDSKEVEPFPLSDVKTGLHGGKWLSDNCIHKKQEENLRKCLTQLFDQYSKASFGKKCLRGNDTQVNESVHGVQSNIIRKDKNPGSTGTYFYKMAMGCLQFNYKSEWVCVMARKLGISLSSGTYEWVKSKLAASKNQSLFRATKWGKLARKNQRSQFSARIKPGDMNLNDDEDAADGVYLGGGGALFDEIDYSVIENIK